MSVDRPTLVVTVSSGPGAVSGSTSGSGLVSGADSDSDSGSVPGSAAQARPRWVGPAIRVTSVLLGLFFLWLAASRADLDAAFRAVSHAGLADGLLVLLTAAAFMALKSLRWWLILRPVARVRFRVLHRLVYIGTAANIVIPHSGELIRSTQLARQHPDPLFRGTVLGTVAVERLLDFAALGLLAALAVVVDPRASTWLWTAGLAGLALVIFGVGLIAALLDPDTPLKRIGRWATRWLPARVAQRLHHHIYRGLEGLDTLRSPRRLLAALVLSLAQWSMVVLAVWASCRAMDVSISMTAAISVFVLSVIGLTLPSAPGQVGTTQLAFVAGLKLSGGDPSLALAASIIYNVWFVIATMLIGGVLWLRRPRSSQPPRSPQSSQPQ